MWNWINQEVRYDIEARSIDKGIKRHEQKRNEITHSMWPRKIVKIELEFLVLASCIIIEVENFR